MTEYPILFRGPMVRAILDGYKVQTRRPVIGNPGAVRWNPITTGGQSGWEDEHGKAIRCPYGTAGDQLWVRETWALDCLCCDVDDAQLRRDYAMRYHAGGESEFVYSGPRANPDPFWRFTAKSCAHWKPSIHMPRWACRILLQVTDVRAERLQRMDPSEVDREGITHPDERITCRAAIERFAGAWDGMYGQGNWAANPWVWVVEFARVEAN